MTALTLANMVDYNTQSNYAAQDVYNTIALAYTEFVGRGGDITTTGTLTTIDFAVADEKQAISIVDLAVAVLAESVKHTKGRGEAVDLKPISALVTPEMLSRFFSDSDHLETEGDAVPLWITNIDVPTDDWSV